MAPNESPRHPKEENTVTDTDYVNNPNQRTPCILVLDASYSMHESKINGYVPIEELNKGIIELEHTLKDDPTALTHVQLAIISVGGHQNEASIVMQWTDVVNFEAFPLKAGYGTPLAEGLLIALHMIEQGKQELRSAGISYTRPWIFVISDGEPTSDETLWNQAIQECKTAQSENKVEVFSIAVEGANLDKLSQFSTRPVIQLSGVKFKELFVWLSSSLSAASKSQPGDRVELPSTDPWRDVGV